MSNLFNKFKEETKKVKIKALDNESVTIRTLTLMESDILAKKMISTDINGDNKVSIDYSSLADIRKEKVSLAMVEPSMTIDDINNLPASASEAINEIADAIDEFNSEGKAKN